MALFFIVIINLILIFLISTAIRCEANSERVAISFGHVSFMNINIKAIIVPTLMVKQFAHKHFSGGSVVKNLPAVQETQVQSLGQEDPLEEGMTSILAWRIPWTEEPGGLQSTGSHSRS